MQIYSQLDLTILEDLVGITFKMKYLSFSLCNPQSYNKGAPLWPTTLHKTIKVISWQDEEKIKRWYKLLFRFIGKINLIASHNFTRVLILKLWYITLLIPIIKAPTQDHLQLRRTMFFFIQFSHEKPQYLLKYAGEKLPVQAHFHSTLCCTVYYSTF